MCQNVYDATMMKHCAAAELAEYYSVWQLISFNWKIRALLWLGAFICKHHQCEKGEKQYLCAYTAREYVDQLKRFELLLCYVCAKSPREKCRLILIDWNKNKMTILSFFKYAWREEMFKYTYIESHKTGYLNLSQRIFWGLAPPAEKIYKSIAELKN